MSLGQRLREIRTSDRKTQEEFGAIGGVRKLAQIKYEKDERQPDGTYLRALHDAGYDVTYIITGYTADEIIKQRKFLEKNGQAAAMVKADLARQNITPNALIESAITGFKTLGEPAAGHLANLYRGLEEDQREHGIRCADANEESLIGNYRRADERGRKVILDTAAALAERIPKENK